MQRRRSRSAESSPSSASRLQIGRVPGWSRSFEEGRGDKKVCSGCACCRTTEPAGYVPRARVFSSRQRDPISSLISASQMTSSEIMFPRLLSSQTGTGVCFLCLHTTQLSAARERERERGKRRSLLQVVYTPPVKIKSIYCRHLLLKCAAITLSPHLEIAPSQKPPKHLSTRENVTIPSRKVLVWES